MSATVFWPETYFLKISDVCTFPKDAGINFAVEFNVPIKVLRCANLWSSIRSVLLITITSAHSTCSTSKFTTGVWEASAAPASRNEPRSGRCIITSRVLYCFIKSTLSSTVTMLFKDIRSITLFPASIKSWKVSLTPFGSATPLDSITMKSYKSPRMSHICSRPYIVWISSSDTLQQTQPFCNSTVSGFKDWIEVLSSTSLSSLFRELCWFRTSFASMFTEATSLTTQPILSPALFSNICFNMVVFPAPKKPLSKVTGMGLWLRAATVGCWFAGVASWESKPATSASRFAIMSFVYA